MIDTSSTFGTTTISCDVKGCETEDIHEGFDCMVDFYGAIESFKEDGWKMKRIDGEWAHTCPCCQANGKEAE